MFDYSNLSIGFENRRVSVSQANPIQLSEIAMRLRLKAHAETSASIYKYQIEYQYQYRYYLAKLSRYESLEHLVAVQLCSVMPEARLRIDANASYVLNNCTDEEIYYSKYPFPQNLRYDEVQMFKDYVSFLSMRRSLLESRRRIWRLYSTIETKKKIQKLWESEYYEALQEKYENDYIYNLTVNDFGRQVKDYAEKLRQVRFSESKKAKESMVLGMLENQGQDECEKKYSDSGSDSGQERSKGHSGVCSSAFPLEKRRVCLHRPAKSESPRRTGTSGKEAESTIPDSITVKKELKRLPPKPEESGQQSP
ncbi:hypothetical protein FG386_002112 [Cryptosporidium ryanae]|uniref:uncharacterized protein n=1 Tax=Cryptosporidium ryanae TaxID=515981 RepID=UPI003519FC66|nr:hypothetical protein FG386_002112 [Cryptosporidium ryanae]